MARDFAAELAEARRAGDWAAHARIWEERGNAEVDADEASIADEAIEQARAAVASDPHNAPFEDWRLSVLQGEHDDHPEVVRARAAIAKATTA